MRTTAPLLLLVPFLASCSLALTHEPPSIWDTPGPAAFAVDSCDPGRTWGVVDIGLALASLFAGYAETVGTLEPGDVRGQYIWVGAVVGLGFATSASVGFKRAAECEDLLNNFGPVALRGASAGDPARPRAAIEPGDADLVTAEELIDVSDRSLYQAVQILRPRWLRRGGFRDDAPSAIVDNQPFELDILEAMRPDEVETVRFISPSDASIRWGTGYPNGAIEVRTRRR